MASISGTITLVQEDRFQLAADDGSKQLFLLTHRAPVGLDDLQALQRAGRRVTVRYSAIDGLIANAVRELSVDGAE